MNLVEGAAERLLPARDFTEADHPEFYEFISLAVRRTIKMRRSVHVHGIEKFPMSGPAVVDPVHRSVIDPFYMGSAMPRAMFAMAKEELWKEWKYLGLGYLLEQLGAFPVDRKKADPSTLKKGMEVLKAGKAVIAFSEGTSKYKGHDIRLGNNGVAWLALRASREMETDCPIVPVGLNSSMLKPREDLHIVIEQPVSTSGYSSTKQSRSDLSAAVREMKQQAYDRARELAA